MNPLLPLVAAFVLSGCASLPYDSTQNALPLGKSGWQLSGGADFEKRVWYVLFVKPWGTKETAAAVSANQIVVPE